MTAVDVVYDDLTLYPRRNRLVGRIGKLSRYEAAIERSLYRALHELQRVQAARQDGQHPASIAVDVTVDGSSPAPDGED